MIYSQCINIVLCLSFSFTVVHRDEKPTLFSKKGDFQGASQMSSGTQLRSGTVVWTRTMLRQFWIQTFLQTLYEVHLPLQLFVMTIPRGGDCNVSFQCTQRGCRQQPLPLNWSPQVGNAGWAGTKARLWLQSSKGKAKPWECQAINYDTFLEEISETVQRAHHEIVTKDFWIMNWVSELNFFFLLWHR